MGNPGLIVLINFGTGYIHAQVPIAQDILIPIPDLKPSK
jgi:hypothetical protein